MTTALVSPPSSVLANWASAGEILTFSLGSDPHSGRRESFGVDVSAIREVLRSPSVTVAPNLPAGLEGMVSLRGELLPVMDLGRRIGLVAESRKVMLVTDVGGVRQGLLVEEVHSMLRVPGGRRRHPPEMLARHGGGLVGSVVDGPDGALVMMLDLDEVVAGGWEAGNDTVAAGA